MNLENIWKETRSEVETDPDPCSTNTAVKVSSNMNKIYTNLIKELSWVKDKRGTIYIKAHIYNKIFMIKHRIILMLQKFTTGLRDLVLVEDFSGPAKTGIFRSFFCI